MHRDVLSPGAPAQEALGPPPVAPEEAGKMLRGLEQLPFKNGLGDVGWFNLEKRRLQEDLRAPSDF